MVRSFEVAAGDAGSDEVPEPRRSWFNQLGCTVVTVVGRTFYSQTTKIHQVYMLITSKEVQ